MKVILTEQQFHNILLNEQITEVLLNSLNEGKNLTDLKAKIKKALLAGVAVVVILNAVHQAHLNRQEQYELEQYIEQLEGSRYVDYDDEYGNYNDDEEEKYNNNYETEDDRIFAQKVNACREYMEYALNNQGYDLSSTNLSPEALVRTCEENNFYLPFVLATGHLESCFGATPRAQKTNSVFSVGSYDNGKNKATYNHPDESILPFINLIQNDYLGNGKTLDDLLKPNGFTNMNGHRYASNPNYENKLRILMNKIVNMYPILDV